jgi:hypothetical protein
MERHARFKKFRWHGFCPEFQLVMGLRGTGTRGLIPKFTRRSVVVPLIRLQHRFVSHLARAIQATPPLDQQKR